MDEKGVEYCTYCGRMLNRRLTGRFSSVTGEPTEYGICLNPFCKEGKINLCGESLFGHRWSWSLSGVAKCKKCGAVKYLLVN